MPGNKGVFCKNTPCFPDLEHVVYSNGDANPYVGVSRILGYYLGRELAHSYCLELKVGKIGALVELSVVGEGIEVGKVWNEYFLVESGMEEDGIWLSASWDGFLRGLREDVLWRVPEWDTTPLQPYLVGDRRMFDRGVRRKLKELSVESWVVDWTDSEVVWAKEMEGKTILKSSWSVESILRGGRNLSKNIAFPSLPFGGYGLEVVDPNQKNISCIFIGTIWSESLGSMEFDVRKYIKKALEGVEHAVVLTSSRVDRNVYGKLMSLASTCIVPRGGGLHSYRFSEAILSGCLPIVFSDTWVVPPARIVDGKIQGLYERKLYIVNGIQVVDGGYYIQMRERDIERISEILQAIFHFRPMSQASHCNPLEFCQVSHLHPLYRYRALLEEVKRNIFFGWWR